MVFATSLFSQLLSLIPRNDFQRAVRDHRAEYGAKGLSSWAHFVSMLFCQLTQAKSLREISDGLRICLGKLIHVNIRKAPPRSTLNYANAHRPWRMFEEVFYQVLEQARAQKHRYYRRVVIWDEENQREIVLLTNLKKFEASTIAAI